VTLLRHRYQRRLVTVPAVFASFFLLVTTLPLWVLMAAFVSPWLPGRLRALRLLWLALVYLALQVAGLMAVTVLWVAAGFGRHVDDVRMRQRLYRLLDTLLRVLMRAARRTLHLELVVDADPPPRRAAAGPPRRPPPAGGPEPPRRTGRLAAARP
jgi:hypothetical protein